MEYDSLIFDLDGTLWDALHTSAAAFTEVFHSYGILNDVTADALKKVTGLPFDECIEKMYPGISDKYPDILKEFDVYERAAIEKKGGCIYPSVVQGIKVLSGKYKIFIVSNCDEWYLQAFLRHSALPGFITDYTCYGKSRHTKSEMITMLKDTYLLHKPVYVGDTMLDYTSSAGCNIDFIYAEYGFGSVDAPCRKISCFDELIDMCIK